MALQIYRQDLVVCLGVTVDVRVPKEETGVMLFCEKVFVGLVFACTVRVIQVFLEVSVELGIGQQDLWVFEKNVRTSFDNSWMP